jgi:hypothetical protein
MKGNNFKSQLWYPYINIDDCDKFTCYTCHRKECIVIFNAKIRLASASCIKENE